MIKVRGAWWQAWWQAWWRAHVDLSGHFHPPHIHALSSHCICLTVHRNGLALRVGGGGQGGENEEGSRGGPHEKTLLSLVCERAQGVGLWCAENGGLCVCGALRVCGTLRVWGGRVEETRKTK